MSVWRIPGLDGSLRTVRTGQIATFRAPGGEYVRGSVPHDGVVIELCTETTLISAASVRGVICHDRTSVDPVELRLVRAGEVVPLGSGTAVAMSRVNHLGVLVRTTSAGFVVPMSVVKRMLDDLGRGHEHASLAGQPRIDGTER